MHTGLVIDLTGQQRRNIDGENDLREWQSVRLSLSRSLGIILQITGRL